MYQIVTLIMIINQTTMSELKIMNNNNVLFIHGITPKCEVNWKVKCYTICYRLAVNSLVAIYRLYIDYTNIIYITDQCFHHVY